MCGFKSVLTLRPFQHLGTFQNVKFIMGTSPLAFFWPLYPVRGDGLTYPVAEGTGKCIQPHNNYCPDAHRIGDEDEVISTSAAAAVLPPASVDAIRARRGTQGSDEEDGGMV